MCHNNWHIVEAQVMTEFIKNHHHSQYRVGERLFM